jgi:hypothetical protein
VDQIPGVLTGANKKYLTSQVILGLLLRFFLYEKVTNETVAEGSATIETIKPIRKKSRKICSLGLMRDSKRAWQANHEVGINRSEIRRSRDAI